MTEDERRERIHAAADMIHSLLSDDDAFVLVVFPREEPEKQARIQFDIISSHPERSYVVDVLEHVVKGIDQHLLEPAGIGEGKPN